MNRLAAVIAALRRRPEEPTVREAVALTLSAAVTRFRQGSHDAELQDDALAETTLTLLAQASAGALPPDNDSVAADAVAAVMRGVRSDARRDRRHRAAQRALKDRALAQQAAAAAAAAGGASAASSCPFEIASTLLDRLAREALEMRHQHRAELSVSWEVCIRRHRDGIGFAEAAVAVVPSLEPLRAADPRTLTNRVAQQQKRLRDALAAAAATPGVLDDYAPDPAAIAALIARLGRCPDRRRVHGSGKEY